MKRILKGARLLFFTMSICFASSTLFCYAKDEVRGNDQTEVIVKEPVVMVEVPEAFGVSNSAVVSIKIPGLPEFPTASAIVDIPEIPTVTTQPAVIEQTSGVEQITVPNVTSGPATTDAKQESYQGTMPVFLSISRAKVSVTEGYSKKLTVNNAVGKVEWSSSKKAVATVSKGTVKAITPGKAVVSAKAAGKTVKCTVTVKKNEYNIPKQSLEDGKKNKVTANVYHISYDKQGNLVVKLRVLNNTKYQITKFNKIGIKLQDLKYKTNVNYSESKKEALAPLKKKDFTITIPKKKLRKKSMDLRKEYVGIQMKYTCYQK